MSELQDRSLAWLLSTQRNVNGSVGQRCGQANGNSAPTRSSCGTASSASPSGLSSSACRAVTTTTPASKYNSSTASRLSSGQSTRGGTCSDVVEMHTSRMTHTDSHADPHAPANHLKSALQQSKTNTHCCGVQAASRAGASCEGRSSTSAQQGRALRRMTPKLRERLAKKMIIKKFRPSFKRIGLRVFTALLIYISTALIGGVFFCIVEGRHEQEQIAVLANSSVGPSVLNWSFAGSTYFAFTLMTTVGYGDFTPQTAIGKILLCVFGIIGIGTTGAVLGVLSNALDQIMAILVRCLGDLSHRIRNFGEASQARCGVGLRSIIIIILGIAWLFLLSGVGALRQGWPWTDGLYFAFVTLSTIGLGEFTLTPDNTIIVLLEWTLILPGLVILACVIQLASEKAHALHKRMDLQLNAQVNEATHAIPTQISLQSCQQATNNDLRPKRPSPSVVQQSRSQLQSAVPLQPHLRKEPVAVLQRQTTMLPGALDHVTRGGAWIPPSPRTSRGRATRPDHELEWL
jgi:uncharacterized membrane protein